MSFIWPAALLLLALIPLGVGIDRAMGRRRRAVLAAAGLGRAPPGRPCRAARRVRRLVPPGILLAALTLLTVAMARPQGVVSLPHQEGTVILAFDVSGSMAATDLAPTRIEAARPPPRSSCSVSRRA